MADARPLTEPEAARVLGVSRRQLQRWRYQGRIGFLRYGRLIRYRLEDLEEFRDLHLVKSHVVTLPRRGQA